MTQDGVPSLPEQEAEGLVGETIGQIVDGVIADVVSGHTVDKEGAGRQVEEAVVRCAHATDFDLAVDTIRYRCPEHLKQAVLKLAATVLLGHAQTDLWSRPEYQQLPVWRE